MIKKIIAADPEGKHVSGMTQALPDFHRQLGKWNILFSPPIRTNHRLSVGVLQELSFPFGFRLRYFVLFDFLVISRFCCL